MLPLIFSSTAALVVLIAAYGLHLVRDDGTSQLGLHVDIENNTQQVSAFVKLIDTLGIKTQKFLRKIYGATHLRSLDRRLKNAGNPEGLSLNEKQGLSPSAFSFLRYSRLSDGLFWESPSA